MKKDIILAGVGVQGILTIATIIGDAAAVAGLSLKQAEVHGMSQRGGDVQSNLRLSTETIYSDLIKEGTADLIISMEPMEALRYKEFMHKDGMVAAFSEDVPYLLRRLPQEFLEEKHSTYDAHISALLDLVQAKFTVPRAHVHAMLMVLTSSMLSRDRIGPYFQPALETLVEGMCRMVIE